MFNEKLKDTSIFPLVMSNIRLLQICLLVGLNVFERALRQYQLARVVVAKEVVFLQQPEGEDLASILYKPPEDAVYPDVDGQLVRLAAAEADGGHSVGRRLRPGDREDRRGSEC